MSTAAAIAIARDAIRDLVAAYAHAADRGRFDDLVALFAPEGVLDVEGGRQVTGREAIAAFLQSVGDAARADADGPALVRHHVSSHRIVVEGPHTARGWAYFAVFGAHGPDHWGRYRDAYVHTGGAWRFASRHVRVDGRAAESWATSEGEPDGASS